MIIWSYCFIPLFYFIVLVKLLLLLYLPVSVCEVGRYGQDCQETCKCRNGAYCNSVDGACVCLAGFIGTHCESVCPKGRYGILCAKPCACEVCDSIHGKCGECSPGYNGTFCDQGEYFYIYCHIFIYFFTIMILSCFSHYFTYPH